MLEPEAVSGTRVWIGGAAAGLLGALVLAILSVAGAEDRRPGWTHVLSVGVEAYDDPTISPLRFAGRDAQAVAAALADSALPTRCEVLTSDAEAAAKPTRSNVLRALQNARNQAAPGDRLLFFFAGHGVERDGRQYLLTSDTNRELIAETALPMTLVSRALSGLQAEAALFILDACRNDPQAGRGDADAVLDESLARGLRPALVGATAGASRCRVATLLACGIGERAWEDPDTRHGVFTRYLVAGLKGGAFVDGECTLHGLAGYLERELTAWGVRSGRQQHPRLENPDGLELVLASRRDEPLVSLAVANKPLGEVLTDLAAQAGVAIVLGQGVDGRIPVSSRFERAALGTVLKALTVAYGLQLQRQDDVYVIFGSALPNLPPAAVMPATAGQEIVAGWADSPPTLDGTIGAEEWAAQDGLTVQLRNARGDRSRRYRLWVRHDGRWLYLALLTPARPGHDSYAAICLDGDDDNHFEGRAQSPHLDLLVGASPGWQGYWYYHSGGQPVAVPPGTGRTCAVVDGRVAYEFAIQLADLVAGPPAALGLLIKVGEDGTADNTDCFPADADANRPETWAKVRLARRPR